MTLKLLRLIYKHEKKREGIFMTDCPECGKKAELLWYEKEGYKFKCMFCDLCFTVSKEDYDG